MPEVRVVIFEVGSNRDIGTVTWSEGTVTVSVEQAGHRREIQRIFDETGEMTVAWVGRNGEEMRPIRRAPGSLQWFDAILFQILPESGYRYRRVEVTD
jgi:hypothetical protein